MGCGSSTPHPKDPTASRNGQVCDWFEDKIGFMNDALKDFINNEVGADTEGKFATTLLRPANAAHLSKAQGLLPLAKQEELVPLLEETVKASGAPAAKEPQPNPDEDAQQLQEEAEQAKTKAVAAGKLWVDEATQKIAALPHIQGEEREAYLAKIHQKADAMVKFFDNVKVRASDGKASSVAVADLLRKAESETQELMAGAVEESGEQFKAVTTACVEAVKSEISDLVQKASKRLDKLIAKVAKKLEENTRKLRGAVDNVGSYNENAGAAIAIGQVIVKLAGTIPGFGGVASTLNDVLNFCSKIQRGVKDVQSIAAQVVSVAEYLTMILTNWHRIKESARSAIESKLKKLRTVLESTETKLGDYAIKDAGCFVWGLFKAGKQLTSLTKLGNDIKEMFQELKDWFIPNLESAINVDRMKEMMEKAIEQAMAAKYPFEKAVNDGLNRANTDTEKGRAQAMEASAGSIVQAGVPADHMTKELGLIKDILERVEGKVDKLLDNSVFMLVIVRLPDTVHDGTAKDVSGSNPATRTLQLTANSAIAAHTMSLIQSAFHEQRSDFKEKHKCPIRICVGTRTDVAFELKTYPPKLVVWCGAGEGYSPQKVGQGGKQPEALDLQSLVSLLGECKESTLKHVMVCLEFGAEFAVENIKRTRQGLLPFAVDAENAFVAQKIDRLYDPASKSLLRASAIPAIQKLAIEAVRPAKGSAGDDWLHVMPFGTDPSHTNITTSDVVNNRPLSEDLNQIDALSAIVENLASGNDDTKLVIINQTSARMQESTAAESAGGVERYCRAAALAHTVCLNLLGPSSTSYQAVFWVNRVNGTLKAGGLKKVCQKIKRLLSDAEAVVKKVLVWFDLREDNGSSPSPENNWLAKAAGSDTGGVLNDLLDTDEVYFMLTGVGESSSPNDASHTSERPSRAPSLLHGDAWQSCTEHWPDAFSEWHKQDQIEVRSLEPPTDVNGSRAANLHESIFFSINVAFSSIAIERVKEMVQNSLPEQRNLASLYYDDQTSSASEVKYIARLCISDVDYLHRIRDCVLGTTDSFSKQLSRNLECTVTEVNAMPAMNVKDPPGTPAFKANGRGDEVLQWCHEVHDAKNEGSDPAVQLTLDMEDGSQDTLEHILPAPGMYNSAAAALAQMTEVDIDARQTAEDDEDDDNNAKRNKEDRQVDHDGSYTDAKADGLTEVDIDAGHQAEDDEEPTPTAASSSTAVSVVVTATRDAGDEASRQHGDPTPIDTPLPTAAPTLIPSKLVVKVDQTRFAEGYEESMLKLDQLTQHQEAKIVELLKVLRVPEKAEGLFQGFFHRLFHSKPARGAHLKAPAGAGKTFVAMDVMLKHLLANRNVPTPVPILYVTRNAGLSYFVGMWMHKRMSGAGINHNEIAELLTNVHILSDAEEAKEMTEAALRTSSLHGTALAVVAAQRFSKGPVSGVMSPTPFSKGVRKFQINGSEDALDLLPVTRAAPYRLIVVDEAHHIYRSPLRRAVVAKIQAESKAQLLLLSDMSQATATAHSIPFPKGLVSVCLTQVVRSSKRIVLASMAFQERTDNETSKLKTESHQQVEGPPLRTYLFKEQDPVNRVAEHADKVIEALEQIATKDFPGLTFDNRVAIITPQEDSDFCRKLSEALGERLKSDGPKHWAANVVGYNRTFEITTAVEASRSLPRQTSGESPRVERIVVDTIDNFDGLERLIVLCVNLDTAITDNDRSSKSVRLRMFESRSVIYRAMTRAHMVVAVINRHVRFGHLEFLLGAKAPGKEESEAVHDLEKEKEKYRDDEVDQEIAAKESEAVAKVAEDGKAAVDAHVLGKSAVSSEAKAKAATGTPKAVELRSVTTSIWDVVGNDEALETPEKVLFSPWKVEDTEDEKSTRQEYQEHAKEEAAKALALASSSSRARAAMALNQYERAAEIKIAKEEAAKARAATPPPDPPDGESEDDSDSSVDSLETTISEANGWATPLWKVNARKAANKKLGYYKYNQ